MHRFKSHDHFTEGVDFDYWWSFSGGGSAPTACAAGLFGIIEKFYISDKYFKMTEKRKEKKVEKHLNNIYQPSDKKLNRPNLFGQICGNVPSEPMNSQVKSNLIVVALDSYWPNMRPLFNQREINSQWLDIKLFHSW